MNKKLDRQEAEIKLILQRHEEIDIRENVNLNKKLYPIPVSYTHLDVYKRQTGYTAVLLGFYIVVCNSDNSV